MANEIASEIKVPIRFTKRPRPISPDFRPDWKISVLLLVLQFGSRGRKSSLTRLHVLNWAVRSDRHRKELLATIEADAPLFAFNVRFEPAFSRAVDLAAAAGLVSWVGGKRLELNATGSEIATNLKKHSDLFVPELDFLETVGKSLTEPAALRLAKGADIV